jgi:hypothetical protein
VCWGRALSIDRSAKIHPQSWKSSSEPVREVSGCTSVFARRVWSKHKKKADRVATELWPFPLPCLEATSLQD